MFDPLTWLLIGGAALIGGRGAAIWRRNKKAQKASDEAMTRDREKCQELWRNVEKAEEHHYDKTYSSIFSSSDKATRIKEINQFFDNKKSSIVVYIYIVERMGLWPKYKFICFERSLTLMTPLERELLRVLWVFYTLDLLIKQPFTSTAPGSTQRLQRHTFISTVGSLVWGAGKGNIRNFDPHDGLFNESDEEPWPQSYYNWIDPGTGKEQVGTERSFLNYFEENYNADLTWTINALEEARQKSPNHPTILDLYNRMHIGNKWLTADEIPDTLYKVPADEKQKRYGRWFGTLDSGEWIAYFGDAATITIAPPGAGKTQCHVIPNLIYSEAPAFVLDVKGELYEKTAGHRARKGPVYKFDLFSDQSHCFNPFDFLRSDPAHLWDDAAFLAEMLIIPKSQNDPFWEQTAQQVLQAVITAMVLKGEDRTISYILDALVDIDDLKDAVYELENSEISAAKRGGKKISRLLEREKEGGSNVLSSILQQASTSLGKLDSPRITKATEKSDWIPDDLRGKDATVYIVLKTGQVDQYAPLLRLVLGLHLRALIETLPPKGSAPVLFMLDEMPQLRYMKPVVDALDLGRQYGVRLWMFAQAVGQIEDHYGDAGAFISKCAVQAFMNPSTIDGTAQMISTALGTRESILDGHTVPLVEASELTGPDYQKKTILLGQGANPATVNKQFAYELENLSKILKTPAP